MSNSLKYTIYVGAVVILIFLRINRVNRYSEQQKEYEETIRIQESIKKMNELNKIQQKEQLKKFQNIIKINNNELYDSYTSINKDYALAIQENKHYIINVQTKEKSEILNIKSAKVLPIENYDLKSYTSGIFIEDNDGWKWIEETQKVLQDLGKADITNNTQFEVRNGVISIKK